MKIIRILSVFLLFLFFLNQPGQAALDSQKLHSMIPKEAVDKQNLGIMVKSLQTGKTVFSYNGEKNFTPASNNKIISSFAALSLLGKDFRFKTELYSGGEIKNGILYGGLYVKGYGDPTIKIEQFRTIAERLKSMGVRKVKEGIYLDDSYYDGISYAEGWKDSWIGLDYCPPVGPFILNYNNIDIHIIPGQIGKPAVLKTFPEKSAFQIENKTNTTKSTST
ncbi:MAG: D-alanyl-D-alanine carboxypeptidase/D-alanyl-D-alanine endopeptidase, partial [Thermodesulfobacteriota bacterium]